MDDVNEHGTLLRGVLEDRIRDAQYERDKHEEQWDINARLYHGAHESVFGGGKQNHKYFTANQIQSAVITQVAVMTERAIRPVFVPRETNEPAEIFLRPESAYKLPEGSGLTDEQIAGAEIIPEPLFDFLASQTIKQMQPNPRAGETVGTGENAEVQPDEIEVDVPVFSDDDFIFVDDALCAEALTQEHDSEWEMSGCDEELRQAITQSSVVGHQDILVQWNDQESRIELINLYAYDTWIDRWATSTRDAEYFIMRRVLPMSEAQREYPEHKDYLKTQATAATDNRWWGGYSGGKYDTNISRKVVEVFTTWERNYPFPMEPQEAIEKGLVQPAVEEPLIDPDTGEIADMGGGPILDERGQQQFITESGESTTPGLENWPVRYGIKQTTQVGHVVLYEGEAEFSDIPVARIRNIPIVESPYGQGEPHRLAGLQNLKNRLWSIYHDYCLFYRSPEQVMPASILNELEDVFKTLHATSGRKIPVPDDLWLANNGNVVETINIPQITDTFFNLMNAIRDEMNQIAGTVDVLRGDAKSEWSGELFAQATSAARGPIGFKARGISEALRHAAKVTAGLIVDFLPLDEWMKRNKKYPPQVLEVMRKRLKRIGYDVSVEVGGASSRDAEAQRLSIAIQNNPVLVNSPTFMKQWTEYLGIKEGEKIVDEVMRAQAAAVPQ